MNAMNTFQGNPQSSMMAPGPQFPHPHPAMFAPQMPAQMFPMQTMVPPQPPPNHMMQGYGGMGYQGRRFRRGMPKIDHSMSNKE